MKVSKRLKTAVILWLASMCCMWGLLAMSFSMYVKLNNEVANMKQTAVLWSEKQKQNVVGDSIAVIDKSEVDLSGTKETEQPRDMSQISFENDDKVENRWTITGANSGNLRIKSASTYFSNYRNFYFNKDVIAMTNDASKDLSNIGIMEAGNGSFYFYYDTTPGVDGGEAFLWCNDFSVEGYEAAVNNWYTTQAAKNIPMYSGLKETKGTFHTDGLGTTNVIGQSVGENVYLGQLHIYKRVPDYYSSTVENRVYTGLDAELQSDGTYKIVMETYATDPTQYQMVEERPTDFIFVIDASSSMTNNEDVYTYTSQGVQEITYNNVEGGGKYVYYDGEYCELARHKYKSAEDKWYNDLNYHCVDFRTSDNRVYHVTPNGFIDTTMQGDGPDGADNVCYKTNVGCEQGGGDTPHGSYEIFTRSGETRLAGMKRAMSNLIDSISALNADHRMAVVTFGSDGADDVAWLNTGLYTNTSTTMTQYTGAGTITPEAYSSVFYNKSQAGTVKQIINAIDTSSKGDSDTYVNYGFDMANNIIENSDATYITAEDMSATTNRNVCVIMLTDGIPGKGGSDTTTATTVANETIAYSKTLKAKGAYVYTIQLGNNNMDGFNMHNYLEYVSSNYLVAENMTTPGSRNTDRIDYHYDFNLTAFTTEDILSNAIVSSIKDNCGNATALLGPDSVIYQQLTEAFIIPDDAQMETELVEGWYDAIGRLTFDEDGTPAPSTITSVLTKTQNHLYVKGYDYSSRYIGNKKPGQKLRVTISGVLANETFGDLDNTSINDVADTAVWESVDHEVPFKYFPYETFSIPEYNYVLDFGFQMQDTDVNGTLKSISNGLTKQTTYQDSAANGMVAIEPGSQNQNLVYSLNPETPTNHAYVLIQRTEGKNPSYEYDWFRINVAPASNVYYEESGADDITSDNVDWAPVGDQKFETQDLTNAKTDTYGYDTHYEEASNDFSNGTASKVVTDSSKKRSDTKTFTFTGTGFDLVSACGKNTGIMTVKVTNTATNKVEKMYVVDTYYRDTTSNYMNANGLLCQVPVVAFTNGTQNAQEYRVEITSAYLTSANALKPTPKSVSNVAGGKLQATSGSALNIDVLAAELKALGLGEFSSEEIELVWFDNNSVFNGGTGASGIVNAKMARAIVGDTTKSLECYLDGFRIYHPLGVDSTNYIASEQDAQYINVINNIGSGVTSDANIGNLAYVEPDSDGNSLTDFTFANYEKTGPENEFYLKPNQGALAFKVQLSNTATVQLGLRAVTGTATVTIGSGSTAKVFDIKSATEMYYDVTDLLTVDPNTGVATVTVDCTSGTLAVNNIKMTQQGAIAIMDEADLSKISNAITAPVEVAEVINGKVTPVVEDVEDTTPDTDVDTDTDVDNDNSGSSGSFFEQLIAMIMEILSKVFANLSIGG